MASSSYISPCYSIDSDIDTTGKQRKQAPTSTSTQSSPCDTTDSDTDTKDTSFRSRSPASAHSPIKFPPGTWTPSLKAIAQWTQVTTSPNANETAAYNRYTHDFPTERTTVKRHFHPPPKTIAQVTFCQQHPQRQASLFARDREEEGILRSVGHTALPLLRLSEQPMTITGITLVQHALRLLGQVHRQVTKARKHKFTIAENTGHQVPSDSLSYFTPPPLKRNKPHTNL
jgi:hypothetical protein